MTEERLVDIETKVSYQEDLLQELNKALYEQQKRIAHLEAVCESLIGHVRELTDAAAAAGPASERPPHY